MEGRPLWKSGASPRQASWRDSGGGACQGSTSSGLRRDDGAGTTLPSPRAPGGWREAFRRGNPCAQHAFSSSYSGWCIPRGPRPCVAHSLWVTSSEPPVPPDTPLFATTLVPVLPPATTPGTEPGSGQPGVATPPAVDVAATAALPPVALRVTLRPAALLAATPLEPANPNGMPAVSVWLGVLLCSGALSPQSPLSIAMARRCRERRPSVLSPSCMLEFMYSGDGPPSGKESSHGKTYG